MRHTTIATLALAALPALALAQDSSTTGGQTQTAPQTSADSTRAMQSQTQGATSEVKPEAMGTDRTGNAPGRRAARSRGAMLSRENITQLQTALSGAGCDAGAADGIIGPRTRRALACARQKNNVTSDQELYRSLNLDFANGASSSASPSGMQNADSTRANTPPSGTTGDNPALPRQNSQGASTDAAGAAATRGDSAQVGGANRGRIYPPADSVRKTTTTPPQRD